MAPSKYHVPGLSLKEHREELYDMRRDDLTAIIQPMKLYDVSQKFSLYDRKGHLILHYDPGDEEGLSYIVFVNF